MRFGRSASLRRAGLLAALCLASSVVEAQPHLLTLQVVAVAGEPIRGIRVGVLGGSTDIPDANGTVRLQLPASSRPGHQVQLTLSAKSESGAPQQWVFLDPWDGIIVLPETGVAGRKVWLVRRGDRAALESGYALRTIAEVYFHRIDQRVAELEAHFVSLVSPAASEPREEILKDVAQNLDLPVNDIDRALREDLGRNSNPYDEALAARYVGDLTTAINLFRSAVNLGGAREAAESSAQSGWILINQGQYNEAIDAFRRATSLEPDVPLYRNGLGNALLYAGHCEEAVQEFRAALALADERGLGRTRLLVTGNLGMALLSAGKVTSARELEEEALAAHLKEYGPEHQETLRIKEYLAATLLRDGDWLRARLLLEEVLLIRLPRFGVEHPSSLRTLSALGVALTYLGRSAEARAVLTVVADRERHLLGGDHPHALMAMGNLAGAMRAEGELEAARKLLMDVISGQRRLLGEEHPDTLTSMQNLAELLWEQGEQKAALDLTEKVAAIRRRVLGPVHLDTLSSLESSARMLWYNDDQQNNGSWDVRAIELMAETIVGLEESLGSNHPFTCMVRREGLSMAGQLLRREGDTKIFAAHLPQLCILASGPLDRLSSEDLWLSEIKDSCASLDKKSIQDP